MEDTTGHAGHGAFSLHRTIKKKKNVCMRVCVHASDTCESQRTTWVGESALSFHHVGPRGRTQVINQVWLAASPFTHRVILLAHAGDF